MSTLMISRQRGKLLKMFQSEAFLWSIVFDCGNDQDAYQRWMDRRLPIAWSALFGDERGFGKKCSGCELIVDKGD